MKATFEFNLPEDNDEYEMYKSANNYHCMIWDFSNYLRGLIKYSDLPEEKYSMADEIREKFYELLNENKIQL